MTGFDLALEIRKLRPDIPIIMCTGSSDKMDQARAKETGIQDFIIKPLNTQKMAAAVRRVLDEKNQPASCLY